MHGGSVEARARSRAWLDLLDSPAESGGEAGQSGGACRAQACAETTLDGVQRAGRRGRSGRARDRRAIDHRRRAASAIAVAQRHRGAGGACRRRNARLDVMVSDIRLARHRWLLAARTRCAALPNDARRDPGHRGDRIRQRRGCADGAATAVSSLTSPSRTCRQRWSPPFATRSISSRSSRGVRSPCRRGPLSDVVLHQDDRIPRRLASATTSSLLVERTTQATLDRQNFCV